MPKLTDAMVKAEPAPARSARIIYDTDVTGLGIRITPNGVKTFLLRYRNAHGVERKARIGSAADWTVAGAREEARKLRREVDKGVDPLSKREADREALTVSDLIDRYLKSARFADKAESTKAIDRGRFERHLRPLLGKKLADDLTHDQVERAFADIRDGKTAIGRIKTKKRGVARVDGGEGTARAAIRLFRAALSWGVREKLVATNAAAGANIGTDGTRQLLLDPAGYAAMFDALNSLETAGAIKQREADAIRVIALTGARRGEIVGLRRVHVDFVNGLIVLPPSRHKTGKSTGTERIIGLPAVAREIIQRQPEGDVIFPIDLAKITKAWALVRAAAGLQSNFGLHGLRHSVASHLAMGGAGAAEIMTAMGHRQMSTSQKYIHWAQDSRKSLAERAAAVALSSMKR